VGRNQDVVPSPRGIHRGLQTEARCRLSESAEGTPNLLKIENKIEVRMNFRGGK